MFYLTTKKGSSIFSSTYPRLEKIMLGLSEILLTIFVVAITFLATKTKNIHISFKDDNHDD